MPRRRKWKPGKLLLRAVMFVLGSLLIGLLAIFLEAALHLYMPRHFSVSIAVGLSVAITLWILKLLKHPPLLLRNVSPLVAGFCAGLGVHIARFWLR